MRISQKGLPALLCLLLLAPPALAEAERELHEAVGALARTSYAWETTTRQRLRADTMEPRLNPNAPVEVRGRFDPDGYTEITLPPSAGLAVAVTAISRMGDVVVQTPLGWMRRMELRAIENPSREVPFEGKTVRLARFIPVAHKLAAMRPLTEDLFDLIADLKSCRVENGLILATLRDAAIEQLWGDPNARRAPEVHGTVIFKLGEEGLSEVHVVLGIGFPNSKTRQVAWTMQQWSTRIRGIGATVVEPPEAALEAIEQ